MIFPFLRQVASGSPAHSRCCYRSMPVRATSVGGATIDASFRLFMVMDSLASKWTSSPRSAAALCLAWLPRRFARQHEFAECDLGTRRACCRPGVVHPQMDGAALVAAGFSVFGQVPLAQSATQRSRRAAAGQEIDAANSLIFRFLCCFAAPMSIQSRQKPH